ncbi:MAG TPA: choice-of-anchor Q domain-containing protein [Acidimicrobiales bacterium]|nr:choice-of-anchor Q domain-containing protein [Acidimicrobiales bacterium]
MFHGVRVVRPVGLRLVAVALVTGAAAVCVAVLPAPVAGAADDVVTNCNGSGAGSLPAVVAAAAAGDTVTFSVSCPPASPIVLSTAVSITTHLTIDGPGSGDLALTGNRASAIFDVGAGVTAAISGLTIENNNGSDPDDNIENPGGIENKGTLTVSDSTFSDNTAGFDGSGGGIENDGILTVVDSTLSGNTAGSESGGGGIWNNGGTLTVSDSTLSDNGGGNGGGISNDGGVVTVTDSTLADNDAYDGGGVGGGVDNHGGTVKLSGDTVAGNTSIAHGGGLFNSGTLLAAATIVAGSGTSGDCGGTITDSGYNLDDDGSCAFSAVHHSHSDVPADLGPLQDNGGPTETEEPTSASPALGEIPTGTTANGITLCPGVDQRGVARPQGTECDIGAVEDAGPQVSAVSPPTGLTTGGTPVTISGTDLTGVTAVHFGTFSAGFAFVNDGTVTASSPPQAAGTVDVTVTTPAGTSAVNPADEFTYTVEQTPTVENCDPSCTATVSSPDPTTVSATGSSGTGSAASMSLVVNTGTLSCRSRYGYLTPLSVLSTDGFASGEALTVTDTVAGEPSKKGVKVCFEGSGSTTTAFLHPCHMPTPTPPCLQSLVESSGSVVATFLSPANDPRFWTGGPSVVLKTFSPTEGPSGTTVTIKGKDLTGVTAVVIGGVTAPIQHPASSTKLVVTVPSGAVTGRLTIISNSGDVVSSTPFTVTTSGG